MQTVLTQINSRCPQRPDLAYHNLLRPIKHRFVQMVCAD